MNVQEFQQTLEVCPAAKIEALPCTVLSQSSLDISTIKSTHMGFALQKKRVG